MSTYHTLDNLSASGKRILLRVDLNVPMQGEQVTDTNRVIKILPTLKRLSGAGAKVIILSHLEDQRVNINRTCPLTKCSLL